MVRILYLPQNANDEIEIRLLVSLDTQSQDICTMCLQYLSLHEDVKCFYIVISRKDRKGIDVRVGRFFLFCPQLCSYLTF